MLHGRLSPGKRGTGETLAIMRQLAQSGARDVSVREGAVRILRGAGVRGHDFRRELEALFRYVADRVRFVRDPHGVELLQAPRYTLEHGFGDCDDKTTLLVALALSVGQPVQLALRAIGATPAAFSHVYAVASVNGQRIPLDPTWPGTPFGWEAPRPALSGDLRV